MLQGQPRLSTGLPGLDRVLKGLLPGDNVVWQVDQVDDYRAFVEPYYRHALAAGGPLIYFRFAGHEALVPDSPEVETHVLRPEAGFETFISEVRHTIRKAGRGAFYVFDCLSDLAADWYSDQMLGNFFMLTCPYLLDMETIAYFAILRNNHSVQATSAISDTTQLLLDVLRHKGKLYLHPLKVQSRHSPTMHMLHVWEAGGFHPVTQSATIAEVQTGVPWLQLDSMSYQLGAWNRTFLEASQMVDPANTKPCSLGQAQELASHLLRMVISRDERVLALAERYLRLPEIIEIGKRMIGTGLVGGKSVGMLLAHAILRQAGPKWQETLEAHDSFYIGSDVFYTFLVQNGIWWVREKQRDPHTFLEGAQTARQRMLTGNFPAHIEKQFVEMLDYFGQSPIIVRSSSLLEDNFGNAFAGKYDSVFCVNQGDRHQRLEDFLSAVRTIYASAMSERALRYRAQRGLLERDEQMALLVQRVSGAVHGDLFFPHTAGVGLSRNPYVWSEQIDPRAGVLRLVFGLGTRAVDRSDDDYTRVVALNAPQRRPEADFDEIRRYAQRRVDCLDLAANRLTSYSLREVLARSPGLAMDLFLSRDEAEGLLPRRDPSDASRAVLTFDGLFSDTGYIRDMRELLRILEEAYGYPVDVEFTTNLDDGRYKINVVQCRPLQVKGAGMITDTPEDIPQDRLAFRAHGAVIGHSALMDLDRVIYVAAATYSQLPLADRYAVARLVGELTQQQGEGGQHATLLIGPGRWGTSTPSLGVPVNFSDISTISVLCEVVAMRDDLVPDVSLGTHFLNELIEMDIVYVALFPGREGNFLNRELFESAPSSLLDLAPQAERFSEVVRVIEPRRLNPELALRLNANVLRQDVTCYLDARLKS